MRKPIAVKKTFVADRFHVILEFIKIASIAWNRVSSVWDAVDMVSFWNNDGLQFLVEQYAFHFLDFKNDLHFFFFMCLHFFKNIYYVKNDFIV